MKTDIKFNLKGLRTDEQVSLKLSELYNSFGYKKYKMRRFEEYSMYLDNKDFLLSQRVITFSGADGKLLALRPDVTLSIVKNTLADVSHTEKLFYNENVYRVRDGEEAEINQIGVEVLGNIDAFNMAEATILALSSLRAVSEQFVLEISHLGFTEGLLCGVGMPNSDKSKVYALLSGKNVHEFAEYAAKKGLNNNAVGAFSALSGINGSLSQTLPVLKELIVNEKTRKAYAELKELSDALEKVELKDRIRLNFSVVNDTDYYNGLIMNGYVKDYPESVLAGGRYDGLLAKFKKTAGAIGFALNLSAIANISFAAATDVLLLYGKDIDVKDLQAKADLLRFEGKSVLVSDYIPENAKFKEIVRLGKTR